MTGKGEVCQECSAKQCYEIKKVVQNALGKGHMGAAGKGQSRRQPI